jgi:hypothetical protein
MRPAGVKPLTPPNAPAALGGGDKGGKPSMAAVIGAFHDGGEVKKTGAYQLEKGEKVVAKKDAKKEGRNSEYRKVYIGRKSKKD